jgi:hypothetical protein
VADTIREPIFKRSARSFLDNLAEYLVRLAFLRVGEHVALQCQIDIHGSAGRLEAKFQRIPSLERPRCSFALKQSRQKAVKCHLPSEPIQIDLLDLANPPKAIFQRPPEGT